MTNYINDEYKISINVPDNYAIVDKKHYTQLGLDSTSQKQTLFLFINPNSEEAESFNVTRDAKYSSDEEALTKGVDANISNLQKQSAIITSKKRLIEKTGKIMIKVMATLENVYINLLFVSIEGLLICVGYINQEQDEQKDIMFEKITNSICKA